MDLVDALNDEVQTAVTFRRLEAQDTAEVSWTVEKDVHYGINELEKRAL